MELMAALEMRSYFVGVSLLHTSYFYHPVIHGVILYEFASISPLRKRVI